MNEFYDLEERTLKSDFISMLVRYNVGDTDLSGIKSNIWYKT